MSSAQKIHSSTQKFTEIIDFIGNVVVMDGGNACIVIEITASNFALLSKEEQDLRIFSYAELLNSLSFPIQILIRNKRMDITSYIKELDNVIANTKNEQLAKYIVEYRTFVKEMVTINVVLNKAFYVVIPFSSLETGAKGVTQAIQTNQSQVISFAETAKKNLLSKAGTLLGQLQKFAVTAKLLEKEDLIKLFYDIYNEGNKIEVGQIASGVKASIVTGGERE